MRNQYTITVTDLRQARHYTLTQVMGRAAMGAVAAIGVILLGSFATIHFLSDALDTSEDDLLALEQQNERMRGENERLMNQQIELTAQVDARARELLALSDELTQIESIIGLDQAPMQPIEQRISSATHTAFERRWLLNSIPSGSPLFNAVVTSEFGMRDHPILEGTHLHGGIDLRAALGTEVKATADGVVEYSGHHSSGLGTMIKLVHNYGFSTIYAHLEETNVRVGQYISKGQMIGRSGNTGRSTGPHLHYEVQYLGRKLDPQPFLEWSIDQYDQLFELEARIQWESLTETVRSNIRLVDQPSSQPSPSWTAVSP
ncbi:MAG: M23 family metallopeptidase [Pseudomonadota bacterium]